MSDIFRRWAAIEDALYIHTANYAPAKERITHHAGHIMAAFKVAKDDTRPRNRLTGRTAAEAQLNKVQRQAALALATLDSLNGPAWQALLRSEQRSPQEREEGEAYIQRVAGELKTLAERAEKALDLVEPPSEARRSPGNPAAEAVSFAVRDALHDLTGTRPTRSIRKTDTGRKDGKLIHEPSGLFIECLGEVFAVLHIRTGPDAAARKAIDGYKSMENPD